MNKEKPFAVVAVSGGLDSCVAAAIAAEQYQPAFAHFNYGQRTEAHELQSFNDIANHYGVERRMSFDIRHFARFGGSSLTDASIEVSKADLESSEIPSSYVPFRNANILSGCVSWAEALGAKAVFIGAVFEDATGYPDCRPEFYDAFRQVVRLGTRPDAQIKIETPIINMTKSEIIKKGVELNAPLHLTWSCYQGETEACGVCDSCAFRLRGFQQAGIDDPIPYKTKPNYL